MLRLVLLATLLPACAILEDHDYDEFPDGVCGNGVVEPGEQCDDGNTEDHDGCSSSCRSSEVHTVHWRTTNISGVEHTCPDGFDLAEVILQPVVATATCKRGVAECEAQPVDEPTVVIVPCANAAARVSLITDAAGAEDLQVAVQFSSSATGEIFGRTLPQFANEINDTVIHVDQGFAALEWALVSPSGEPRSCEVDDIALTLTRDGLSPFTEHFFCADHSSLSPALTPGTYDLELTAGDRVVTHTGIVIRPRSALTEVPLFTITLPL